MGLKWDVPMTSRMTIESESLLLRENPKVESPCHFGILRIAKFVQLSRKWLFSRIIQLCEGAGHVFIFMISASGRVCKDSYLQCHLCGSRNDFMYQYLHTGSTILAFAGFCL